MTELNRWLDELSEDAPERTILLAGYADAPSHNAVEQGFKALSATLGVTATTAYVGTAVAKSATTTVTTGTTTVTTGASLVALAVKPIVLGFVLGSGLLGGTYVVERSTHRSVPTTTQRAPKAPVFPARQVNASEHLPVLAATDAAEHDVVPPAVLERTLPGNHSVKSEAYPSTTGVVVAPELTLTEQARALARIKRLMFAGNSTDSLILLKRAEPWFANSALAEEHEALYVEALSQNHQLSAARARAASFLVRFPNSPHREKMRTLITRE
jgi:hypothetical protein